MLKRRLLTLLSCALVVVCGEAAHATTAVVPRDAEMVVESRAILTGQVLGLSTAVDADTELVYTYIRLQVTAVIKGKIAAREVVIKELGGETRDHGTLIFGMPSFQAGQEVLVYLNTWPDGALRVHQGLLGKFNINRDPLSGRVFVERQLEGENVEIMAASGHNGTNRSELDSYMKMVNGLLEANRKSMRAFEMKYYSDIPVLAEPLEFVRPGFEMTPQWVLLNPGSPARWFEPDSNQPVVFYVNPSGSPGLSQVAEDMQAAMNAWSSSGASLRVNYGGPTGGCGIQLADRLNTISFNNCDNYFAVSQSCSGLVAVSGIVRYLPDTKKTIGGVTYGKAVEANMSFNPYAFCNFTTRCQVQEVATHEMGHALGLGHSSDASATMAAYVHFDNRCASLTGDDVRGITSVYPGGSAGVKLNISTSEIPSTSINRDYSTNLEAKGGTGGYQWSLVGGQMPPGIQLGMSGLVFGKADVPGDFSFVAQVRDSAGNASQATLMLVVRQPGLPPLISGVEFRKKKVFVSGRDFEDGAIVYVDGEGLTATLDGTRLITQKRKQKPGLHQVYVVNPDGSQSNTFQFSIE
ncbi:MAG: matrixin family metalloprotease [Blastocatellia bacterium]